ncbi:MAG: DUF3754 domain-containing protein, partial [Chloroflexi bacterium]|nr:DUF3754 domain-containing protein [Chloroflexota bacterium]
DRFIPVRAEDLASVIAGDVDTFGENAAVLQDVADAITLVIDQEVGVFERQVAHEYAPFNPDRDTIILPGDEPSGETGEADGLIAMLSNLLWQANFEEMDEDQLVAAIRAANTHGMRIQIDPEKVRVLRVWVRGRGTTTRIRRARKRPWKKESYELEVLKRLVVAIRLRNGAYLMLKMFKDIPLGDLEALMPHAKVKMGPRDFATTIASGGGAVWTIGAKIVATGLAAAGSLLYVLALPLVGLSWKTFSSYRRALKDRDSDRTKHLYYQNLANNASAIHMLATNVAQAEVKEALLCYAICFAHKLEGGTDLIRRLHEVAENYLSTKLGIDVNFDIHDALETMDRLALWEDREALRVVPPEEALTILDEHRRQRRSANYHLDLALEGQFSDPA